MERVYHVSGAALQPAGSAAAPAARAAIHAAAGTPWYERATSADYAQSLLQGGGFFAIIGLYFVAGAVLSLLPCSYPMIPILSAIIIGEGARVTRARGFALSLAYVIGMALVYTALGVAAALVGQSLGAWLQNPWVLGAFGVLLTIFALTLIAGFDIALPQRWQDGVSRASTGRSGGKFAAVAVMGALSALVVGACMTAPLFAGAGVHRTYRRRRARRCCAVLDGPRSRRAAADPRAGRRHAVAACRRVDGRRQGVLRRGAARGRVVDRLAGARRDRDDAVERALVADRGGVARACSRRRLSRLQCGVGLAGVSVRRCAIWAAVLLVGLAAGSSDPLRPLAVLAARAGRRAVANASNKPDTAPQGDLTFAPVRSIE